MLVSIQEGMFLEPLSQIVTNEVVGTVEMDLSVEKVRPNGKAVAVTGSNRVSETGQGREWFWVSRAAGDTTQFAGHETRCRNSARITLVAPQIWCWS